MKKIQLLLLFVILLLAAVCLSACVGGIQVPFGQLIRGLLLEYDDQVAIIWDLRFPRILIALMTGASMAVSGVLFQAALRNPLADPGIIGISAGASFAASVVVAFFPTLYFAAPAFAFLGGLAAFLMIFFLAGKSGGTPLKIVLIGVAVHFMFTGLSTALGYVGSGAVTGSAGAVLSGSLTMKTWVDVRLLSVYALLGLLAAFLAAERCNLLLLEDRTVRGLGIHSEKLRVVVSVIAVVLASITTAVAGVIGFTGLVGPHLGRIFVGSDHKYLIPFSMVMGAFITLTADTLGRMIFYPVEIPASVVLSVLGGPFFIFLLVRQGSNHEC